MIETASAFLLLLGTVAVLSLLHLRGRVGPSSSGVVSAQFPHEAFRVWQKSGVRGKTLVLMDRYLSAETGRQGTYAFSADELSGPYSAGAICAALRHDGYRFDAPAPDCSLQQLNDLLKQRDFYEAWSERWTNGVLPSLMQSRLGRVSTSSEQDAVRAADLQEDIVEVNRRLLERTYPRLVPPKDPAGLVGRDNYIYQAIAAGYVRKVYHLIPGSAWNDVERTLSASRAVVRRGSGFRLVIEDGVPIMVSRLQDLPVLSEDVLLSVNSALWSEEEIGDLAGLFAQGRLRSRLVVVSGMVPQPLAEAVRRQP